MTPTSIDYNHINSAAIAALPELLVHWLPDGRRKGREYVAINPRREDRTLGSFSINLATGKWADFACGACGGDPISLAAYLGGIGQAEAARRLAGMLGVQHD
jgi:DNA primase